ncbi:MAG: DUF6541 family protein [Nanoarchaeota archaeon]
MRRTYELLLVAFIYLCALWLWTLPFQQNQMPYGEPDATSHFVLGDAQAQGDKPIVRLPPFIDVRYGLDNAFVPHTLWYHPPYHMNFALMQVLGGSRFVPIYLFNAMLCTVMVLVTYFVMRKLFGFIPALISAVLLMFSGRDIMIYLWGQWPERISYAMVPLVLYCFYKYVDGLLQDKPKALYLYLAFVLLGVNFYLHPVGLYHTLLALMIYGGVILAWKRRLPFEWKHLGIGVAIFVAMAAIFPLQTGSVLISMATEEGGKDAIGQIGRLFQWYPDPARFTGAVPPTYFSYAVAHGIWTLPFLLLGIIFLFIRRRSKDMLLLSWLLSLYIMIHLDIIGKGRIHRSLAAESFIFYPLIALGFAFLLSLVKLPKRMSLPVKAVAVAVFLGVIIFTSGSQAYASLKDAYPSVSRLTTAQYEAASWMQQNLPENALIEDVGTLTLPKKRFIQFISQRHIVKINGLDENMSGNHVLMDYSDIVLLGPGYQEQLAAMQAIEQQLQNSSRPLYDKNYLRVYRLG